MPSTASPSPVSSGGPSSVPSVPDGGRLVKLEEPASAVVSKSDQVCFDSDPVSDVTDPCQTFYVLAARGGPMTVSVTWDFSGNWLSLRAAKKYPVYTSRQSLTQSYTVTAGIVYAFEVGLHDPTASDSQSFTLVITQP
jgi:hypothetical protein